MVESVSPGKSPNLSELSVSSYTKWASNTTYLLRMLRGLNDEPEVLSRVAAHRKAGINASYHDSGEHTACPKDD